MAQLINEAKRMQHLAGILSENKEEDTSVMEGLNLYLEILEYNSLFEAEGDKKGFLSNILTKVGQKGAAFFGALNSVYNQIKPEEQNAIKDAIKYISDNNLTADQVKKELGLVKEAEEDDSESTNPKSKLGRLRNFLNKTIPGKVSKAVMGILIGTALMGPIVKNFVSSLDSGSVKQVTQSTNLDRDTGIGFKNYKSADDVGIKVGGQSLKSIDSKPNTVVDFTQFAYGKGKQLSPQGEKELNNLEQKIEDIIAKNPNAKVNIDVTGTVSKTTGNSLKGTDTKDNLDVARGETVKNILQQKFGNNPNVNIKTNPNPSDSYKSQSQEKVGGDKGAGAIIAVSADIKNQPAPKDPTKFIPTFNPEYAEFDAGIPKDTEKAEEPTSTGAAGSETLPKTEPSPSTPSSPQDIKATATEFSKLNRNGQIATVLSKINPGLDISKKLGQGKITSYTDANLTATQGDAKKLAALIMNIRKNPDALLKKVANATGIKLEPRAKAVTTKVTKGTQAQLQAIKESSLISLLREAMIDQISDEDIKKNQDMILALLGTMYASAGNTELSIVPKDSAQAQKLKDMGFAPQPGGNYVFLAPGQTKAQVQNFDTQADKIKTQPDVVRVDKKSGAATTYKTALSRIKTPNDFADLIVKLIPLTNTQFQQDKTKVNSAFFSLRNRIKIQESVADVDRVIDVIKKDSIFSSLLSNVNTAEEFVQLILRDIVPDLPPALKQGENIKKVKSAIITAANTYSKQRLSTTQNSEPAPAQHSSAYNKQQREKQASAASKK